MVSDSNMANGAAPSQGGLGLIKLMSPYWDSHMSIPVMDWMLSNEMITPEEREQMGQSLLGQAATTPAGRAAVEAEIREIEAKLVNFNNAIEAYKREQQKRIGGYPDRKTLVDLSEWWMTNSGQSPAPPALELGVDALVPRLAKLYYDIGDYKQSLQQLQYMLTTLYELLAEGTNTQTRMACYWGVCACIILLHHQQQSENKSAASEETEKKEAAQDEELLQTLDHGEDEEGDAARAALAEAAKKAAVETHTAAQCILKLGDILDQVAAASSKKDHQGNPPLPAGLTMSREQQLLNRSWLLHWSVWPLFRYYFLMVHTKQFIPRNQAWSLMLEWVLHEGNLSCVTVVCPHLLRYYAVYAILNRKRKDHFQAVITAIGQGKNRYSDPFTSLLEALFLDFNFDEAQHHIARIGEECDSDFFLQPLKGAINEFARLLIFETYCRIHKCINVDMIAKKVNMSPEAAERWIVNLIRHARLEARIDSEKNRVQMSAAPPNLYQQVIDKTRNLCIRSNLILQNIARPAGFTGREGDDVVTSRTNRQRGGRGRQWVQGGEGDGFYRGEGGRGGRGGRGDRGHMGDGRRDPMAAVAASMASRRQDDTAFAA
ncbi:PCI domain-containing protein [Toxoplasma gondii ARI]|uniref:Eukaryotic translation initiation factor 3 subunit E n=1 Tax=Toxoplasma gondii ARI TaxID=1074872 RepID=A0A139Y5R1_TOXGO|nr:PCI domain-containing protein [Toxoplasma gondii ARI]